MFLGKDKCLLENGGFSMSKMFQHSIIVGLALFAIYFGAGNLIFPPSIGNVSGTSWIPALIGFCITGIALPLMAVIAILNVGGKFENLTKPISPWFHKVFNLLLMVGIGMFVTIPRMAATTHELGVSKIFPYIPSFVTIVLFFAVSFYFAMDRSNVIDRIGKWLTPVLVVVLVIIVFKGMFSPIGMPAPPSVKDAFSNAFIHAYQTGDVVTGIFCAPIFLAAIVGYGYKGASMKKIAWRGVAIAGAGLFIVYGGLLYLGATGSSIFPKDLADTALVSELIHTILGGFGGVLLAIAIALACLTSAIGVIVVIAEFLDDLTKKVLNYKVWAAIVCITGICMGSLGVARIVDYTMPIFTALYPVAIVLILLGTFNRFVPNSGSYRGAILLTFIVSLVETFGGIGIKVPLLFNDLKYLPLSENGFAWLVPAILGFVAGGLLYRKKSSHHELNQAIEDREKEELKLEKIQ